MRGIIVCLLLAIMTGCANQAHSPTFEHVVIIWLKDVGNADARQKLIDRSYTFQKIPGVKKVVAGPMLPSDRKTVDSTYDVGVVITFDSEKSLRAYDQHPIHQQAIKEVLAPLASRFIVYDFVAK